MANIGTALLLVQRAILPHGSKPWKLEFGRSNLQTFRRTILVLGHKECRVASRIFHRHPHAMKACIRSNFVIPSTPQSLPCIVLQHVLASEQCTRGAILKSGHRRVALRRMSNDTVGFRRTSATSCCHSPCPPVYLRRRVLLPSCPSPRAAIVVGLLVDVCLSGGISTIFFRHVHVGTTTRGIHARKPRRSSGSEALNPTDWRWRRGSIEGWCGCARCARSWRMWSVSGFRSLTLSWPTEKRWEKAWKVPSCLPSSLDTH